MLTGKRRVIDVFNTVVKGKELLRGVILQIMFCDVISQKMNNAYAIGRVSTTTT